MGVEKIISGGQTGADQGGLAAGQALGLKLGGWLPQGWRTDEGPRPDLAQLGLQEHWSPKYPPRTAANVQGADGTLIILGRVSSGTALTQRLCQQYRKPYHVVELADIQLREEVDAFRHWLRENRIRVLNVAGNRERIFPGIFAATRDFIVTALSDV